MRQFYTALDELSFLFQWRYSLEGHLDQKLGEVVAAYVYDLELTLDCFEFSEARASDGRSVQVRTTRSRRGIVSLTQTCEHLLVVRLWGRKVVESTTGRSNQYGRHPGVSREMESEEYL